MSKVAFVQDGVVILGIGDTEEEAYNDCREPEDPTYDEYINSDDYNGWINNRCGGCYFDELSDAVEKYLDITDDIDRTTCFMEDYNMFRYDHGNGYFTPLMVKCILGERTGNWDMDINVDDIPEDYYDEDENEITLPHGVYDRIKLGMTYRDVINIWDHYDPTDDEEMG